MLNSKLQIPNHKQITIQNRKNYKSICKFWLLEFRNCLLFVICGLFIVIYSNAYALNLDTLKTNLLRSDYKAAITEGEKLIAKDPHSDELYYLLGLCYLKDGNYLRAAEIFEVILKEFNGSKFKEEAMLGLGDTYLLRDNFVKAREIYQDILKDCPDTKLKAQLYYRLSEIGFKKGDLAQGRDYFVKLSENYPLALEIKQSQDICPVDKNNFNLYYSIQVGSFSNPANANNLTQKLLGIGYPAYVEESTGLTGSKTFRVKVGKLKTRQEAEGLDKKLAQEGYPTRICP